MASIPGMFQRGSRYWLRVVAPLELRAKFYSGKKIAFEGSLGTGDPEVARVAAAAKRYELEAQFLASAASWRQRSSQRSRPSCGASSWRLCWLRRSARTLLSA